MQKIGKLAINGVCCLLSAILIIAFATPAKAAHSGDFSSNHPSENQVLIAQSQTSFPLKSETKAKEMGGGFASSSATLSRNGMLHVEATAVSKAKTQGTYAQTYVVGLDSQGNEIFVSRNFAMKTACGTWDPNPSCHSKVSQTFNQDILPQIAEYTKTINVYVEQRGSPDSVKKIKRKIRNACQNYTDLPAAVRAAIALESGGTSEVCGLAD